MLAAILAIICGVSVITCCSNSDDQTARSAY